MIVTIRQNLIQIKHIRNFTENVYRFAMFS